MKKKYVELQIENININRMILSTNLSHDEKRPTYITSVELG